MFFMKYKKITRRLFLRDIAIYLRISLDDKDNFESESIKNQRLYLKEFIKKDNELSNNDIIEYCDDGISGMTFSRPAINKLLEDIKIGKIGCVIVKDFSRFGRNYIEVGNYIENIFPIFKVRFISVNDNYDSKFNDIDIKIGFANLAYEMYSKDLSLKVKATKRRNSNKNISILPYGYKKIKDEIVIDTQRANVVKTIFNLRIKGETLKNIAIFLNNNDIKPPIISKSNKNYWNTTTISRILKNKFYIENQPIIEKDIFLEVNKKNYKKNKNINVCNAIFRKKLICSGCKRTLSYRLNKKNEVLYYFCRISEVSSKNNCFNSFIYENEFYKIISDILKKYIDIFKSDYLKIIENKYNDKIKSFENKKIILFDKYIFKKIEKDNYIYEKQKIDIEIKKIKNLIYKLKQPIFENNILKNKIIDIFISSIFIYNDNKIELKLSFLYPNIQ